MVVTRFVPTVESCVWHDRTGVPSSCTVQAPHWPMPQPNFVPFMWRRVPQDPEQGHFGRHIHRMRLSVDDQRVRHGANPPVWACLTIPTK